MLFLAILSCCLNKINGNNDGIPCENGNVNSKSSRMPTIRGASQRLLLLNLKCNQKGKSSDRYLNAAFSAIASTMRKNHLLLVLALAIPSLSLAAIVEEVLDVPVSVKTMYGQEVNQAIKVTIFRDDQREKAPYLVLNHGRPATVAGFAGMKRQRYSDNSRYFVALGFVVLVPTRVGYGETGGPDVEDSGRCESRNFAPAYAVAADQTAAVLDFAANLAYVDRSRGVVVGQSFGGMTSITLSTRQVPGLMPPSICRQAATAEAARQSLQLSSPRCAVRGYGGSSRSRRSGSTARTTVIGAPNCGNGSRRSEKPA
jgi:hypothetical protein